MGLSRLFDDKDKQLLQAARAGRQDAVRVLLSEGASADAHDINGVTALMLAAEKGATDVIDLLLRKGADAALRNKLGMRADKYAKDHALAALLERAAMKTDVEVMKELESAVFRGDLATVRNLVLRGADVNASADNESPPLHWAANLGFEDIVTFLLESGAEINRANEAGETALHYAAGAGRADVAVILMEQGADKSHKSNWGTTAEEKARRSGYRKTAHIIQHFTPTPPPPLKPRGFSL